MGMTIVITITDQDTIDDMIAVGARDLRKFFLPDKLGIKAKRVRISEISDEEKVKQMNLMEYKFHEDIDPPEPKDQPEGK